MQKEVKEIINDEEITRLLSSTLNMTSKQFEKMFNHKLDINLVGPNDVKVASANLIKANRMLAKLKSFIKIKESRKSFDVNERTRELTEIMHKHKRELKAGLLPLSVKEQYDAKYEHDLERYKKTENSDKKNNKKSNISEPVKPRYTSVNITKYTSIDLKEASPTLIKQTASSIAEIENRNKMLKYKDVHMVASELHDMVKQEAFNISNVAKVMTSEHHSMRNNIRDW